VIIEPDPLTEADVPTIRAYKPAILAYLASETVGTTAPPPRCRTSSMTCTEAKPPSATMEAAAVAIVSCTPGGGINPQAPTEIRGESRW
jgi:hypothetical protein